MDLNLTVIERAYMKAVLLKVLPAFLLLAGVVFLVRSYVLPWLGFSFPGFVWLAVLIVLGAVTSYRFSGEEASRLRKEYAEKNSLGGGS